MLTIIFHQVPYWVWLLLAALIVLGSVQALPRRRTLKSAILISLAMVVLSLYGVLAVFSHQALPVLAWGMGLLIGVVLCQIWKLWGGIVWSASDRRLNMPGSWLPLAVFMGLFSVKFAVGMTLAMQPGMTMNPGFASLVGLVYGSFSGLFLGRGIAALKAARSL
jgi:hypothetical protein